MSIGNFPNVPNVPGVPPLIRNPLAALITSPALLLADTISLLTDSFNQQWGIFKGGLPIVVADNVIAVDYRQDWILADYPIEEGGFETYDKVQTPFDFRVRFSSGGSEANRQALLDSISAIADTLDLFDIVTPEVIYQNVNVRHYDYRRTAVNGVGLLTVDVYLLEIRSEVSTSFTMAQSSGTKSLTNTQDPGSMSAVDSGIVQTGTPTQTQQSLALGVQ
jgi:hypothetical protein